MWDAFNSNFNRIEDKTPIRGEAVPDGLFHLAYDVLVQHTDGTYLLMRRDIRKHFGGMWEAVAGGSAMKGESPLECAARELKEETSIASGELSEVGRVASGQNRSVYVEFLCVTDWDKNNIILREGETSAFQWAAWDELLKMEPSGLVTTRMQKFIEELGPMISCVPVPRNTALK